MITLNVKQFQASFFDRVKVDNAIDKARVRVLGEFGRLVRKRAQSSLRYGDRVSLPGMPPTARKSGFRARKSKSTGKTRVRRVSYLREFLYFAYDKTTETVVVGPAKLNAVVSQTALPALEFGGRTRTMRDGKSEVVRVAARPFMGPALEAERPKLAPMWRNSIK
jgi:phage gpG-like protein